MLMCFKNFVRRIFSGKKTVIDQRSKVGGDDNSTMKMNAGRDISVKQEKNNEHD